MTVMLSGDIGSGKSTVVRTALAQLGWTSPSGFRTHWGGGGRGAAILYLSTWDGDTHPVARRLVEPKEPGGLPYELDTPRFEQVAIASLRPAAANRPVVIDELGLLELGAAGFVQVLADIWAGPVPVLVVIQRRALAAWLPRLDPAAGARRFEVEPATRDALPKQIAAAFRS